MSVFFRFVTINRIDYSNFPIFFSIFPKKELSVSSPKVV